MKNLKLTVLVDNNTLIDRYFLGEPAVSYFIETDGIKILFDTGYSDIFIKNAQKLNINLLDLDFVVLSHGHLDHTWGLVPLIQNFSEALIEKHPLKIPRLVAHPEVLTARKVDQVPEIGSLLSKDKLGRFFDLRFGSDPQQLTEQLFFLGEIERTTNFEAQEPLGKIRGNGGEIDDYLLDDSALAYKSANGLVIITGCSHAGICNIVEYAKKVCGEERVVDIIGGFHLLNPPQEKLQMTIEYLKNVNPKTMHACHCTDLKSKIEISKSLSLREVGVGLVLEY